MGNKDYGISLGNVLSHELHKDFRFLRSQNRSRLIHDENFRIQVQGF